MPTNSALECCVHYSTRIFGKRLSPVVLLIAHRKIFGSHLAIQNTMHTTGEHREVQNIGRSQNTGHDTKIKSIHAKHKRGWGGVRQMRSDNKSHCTVGRVYISTERQQLDRELLGQSKCAIHVMFLCTL